MSLEPSRPPRNAGERVICAGKIYQAPGLLGLNLAKAEKTAR
jgi:hypothetical protein